MPTALFILLFLGLGVGSTALQVYLSCRPNRYFGLLLPTSLLLIGVISALIYSTVALGDDASLAALLLAMLLLCIPAFLMLVLYALCRIMRKPISS